MDQHVRAILLGGSSHAGKSTAAVRLAQKLGWRYVPTDTLGRHPGRPWKNAPEVVPPHVAEHYRTLPVEELITDVLRHYRANIWPQVERIIGEHTQNDATQGVIIEGSALWPEFAAQLDTSAVAAAWITAADELFQRRIHAESAYETRSAEGRVLIDKFLARTLRYNTLMMQAVRRLGLAHLHVHEGQTAEAIAAACVAAMRPLAGRREPRSENGINPR